MRDTVLVLGILAVVATSSPAQSPVPVPAPVPAPVPGLSGSWADKMFKDGTVHDFGTVARGAQLFHRFTMTNIYAVPLDIVDVRTSCGCSTATPSTRRLEPRATGYIDVNMDGRRFTGAKSIRVHVTVGPQFVSTAELKVTANSRADVVFNPGQVTFGVVPLGSTPTQTIEVEYAGTLDWRIEGVVTNGAPFDVALEEMYRRPGQVGYRARFTLQPKTPIGALKQEVFLQTNDPASQFVPVVVEATVQAMLTVSPDPVQVGNLPMNQEVVRKVMVRGNRPFRILAVDGLGNGVSVNTAVPSPAPQTVHTVLFRCHGTQPGPLQRQVLIRTDLQEAPVAVTLEGTVGP